MKIRQALGNIRNVSPDLAEEEIVCIRANREKAVPVLLEYIKLASCVQNQENKDYNAHFYAMYLLAEFRVKEAFNQLIQYLEYDNDSIEYLLGDSITGDFGSILASVATVDDIPRLKNVIENTGLDTFARNAALDALQVLYVEDVFDRDSYITYLQYLLETCHDDPTLLAFIICDCEDAGFRDLLPVIEKLFDKKLVDEQVTDFPFVENTLMYSDEAEAKESLTKNERKLFVSDTIAILKTWYYFSEKFKKDMSAYTKKTPADKKQKNTSSTLNDFEQYIQKNKSLIMLKLLAEEREPEYELEDMLTAKKVDTLRRLGSHYKVANSSKWKKAQLVPLIAEKMQDMDTLKANLTILNAQEWEFFKKAVTVDHLVDEKKSANDIISLYAHGLMSVYYFYSHFYFVVPAQIRQMFINLDREGFSAEKDFTDLLNDYAIAAVNMYGVITQDDFVELFNSQNDRKTNIDEMFGILIRFVFMEYGYVFWDKYIVSNEFEEGDYKDVELYAKIAATRPRFLPDREEFLKRSDWGYVEQTQQLHKLKAYISRSIAEDEMQTDEIVKKFYFFAIREAEQKEYIETIEEYGILLSADKIKVMMSLIYDLSNNVRTWLNNGHTASELGEIAGEHLAPPSNEPIRVIKIGRNEPCPCGSGKKYKKCCGI